MRKRTPQDEGTSVPGWIVSFSDMVTLLLAFFVLLQTFAKQQDPELFYAGQGSFRRAVSGFGLSTMFSGEIEAPLTDWRKIKYPSRYKTTEPDVQRVIDSDDEAIRQAFREMRRQLDVQGAKVDEEKITVYSAPIIFAAGSARLDAAATAWLTDLASELSRAVDPARTKLYVIGLAADEGDRRTRWLLSARRAEAVHEALAGLLGQGAAAPWAIYPMGAGPGGQWCRSNGVTAHGADTGAGGTHVAISVVRTAGR